jgi:hypothetical protein
MKDEGGRMSQREEKYEGCGMKDEQVEGKISIRVLILRF